jgi:Fe-S cluster assembly protein SufB
VDPELLRTFEKLGISLTEQNDYQTSQLMQYLIVFLATTYQEELSKYGVIFSSISEAMNEYPDLIENT